MTPKDECSHYKIHTLCSQLILVLNEKACLEIASKLELLMVFLVPVNNPNHVFSSYNDIIYKTLFILTSAALSFPFFPI